MGGSQSMFGGSQGGGGGGKSSGMGQSSYGNAPGFNPYSQQQPMQQPMQQGGFGGKSSGMGQMGMMNSPYGMGSGFGRQNPYAQQGGMGGGFNPFGGGPAPSYMSTTAADMGYGQQRNQFNDMNNMMQNPQGGMGNQGQDPYAARFGTSSYDNGQRYPAPISPSAAQTGGGMGASLAQQMQQRGMGQFGGMFGSQGPQRQDMSTFDGDDFVPRGTGGPQFQDMRSMMGALKQFGSQNAPSRGYGSPTELYAPALQSPQQGQMSFDEFINSGRMQDQAYRTPQQQSQKDQEDYQKYLSSPRQMGGSPQQQLGFDAGMGGNMRQGQIPQYAMGALANLFGQQQQRSPMSQSGLTSLSGGLGGLAGLLGGRGGFNGTPQQTQLSSQAMYRNGGRIKDEDEE
jgi:hypothetical protein